MPGGSYAEQPVTIQTNPVIRLYNQELLHYFPIGKAGTLMGMPAMPHTYHLIDH